MIPIRALPRIFVPGASALDGPLELPQDDLDKLRKVLRLGTGDPVAILPNDGTLLRCVLDGRRAVVDEVVTLDTEPAHRLTICQAMPKGDKLDDVLRSCTELGVAKFIIFPSERTVVRWDDDRKIQARLTRARAIVRESAELAFRGRLPEVSYLPSLDAVFEELPDAVVLDETDTILTGLGKPDAIIVGPEGGWAPRERARPANRATLGPRVLRSEHAGAAAVTLILLS